MAELNTSARTHLVAFFNNRSEALSAISDLKDAGFTSDQIGLAMSGGSAYQQNAPQSSSMTSSRTTESARSGGDDRSAWEKIKDFFRGEDDETYRAENSDETFGDIFSGERGRYYSSGVRGGGAVVTVRVPENRTDEARQILVDHNADMRTSGFEQMAARGTNVGSSTSSYEPNTGRTTSASEQNARRPAEADLANDQRIQLRGELLRAVKERVQRGEIRLRKEVVSENQTINVPVSREEVIVEQVPASGSRPLSGAIGDQGEVRIPVSEERVKVSKEPVVTGEVRVQKRTVQDTQQVSDQVRHEEVKVDNQGDVKLTDKTKTGKKKPAA